ncbi:Vps51/Vps67-domain-containing protein [Lipomyces tetrasporus]|uniref:Vacuolar protein sorting-associated protein 51 homolog n=1 Tax=Lipomyces tetrasporus TaxID=54092 RepID=A0AAD7QMK8_9ASCO|nr:Vps51/Vps67-domain-containing protein [Lipomyces tetrasporus]KAJ8097996.1 Vps51/Vps67-domain-containing protein [Lipomyces tetrasporus]
MSAIQTPLASAPASARTSLESTSTIRSVSSSAPHGAQLRSTHRVTPTRSTAAAARRHALREFYAIGQDRYTAGVPPSDIDRPDFRAEVWLDKFVRENKTKDVLNKENTLLHEIRALDGEGKALVYDNYNKLISATETIQSMRGNMDPLQPTTSALEPAVAHIAEVSTTLIATLSERRRKNDAEDVSSESKGFTSKEQADFLRAIVNAPRRIRELIQKGEVEKARADWDIIEPVLNKLKRINGVDRIVEDCITALKAEEKP